MKRNEWMMEWKRGGDGREEWVYLLQKTLCFETTKRCAPSRTEAKHKVRYVSFLIMHAWHSWSTLSTNLILKQHKGQRSVKYNERNDGARQQRFTQAHTLSGRDIQEYRGIYRLNEGIKHALPFIIHDRWQDNPVGVTLP